MRILSKFKDYYDSALGFGFDEELVYLRKRVEHMGSKSLPPELEGIWGYWPKLEMAGWVNPFSSSLEWEQLLLGFCGRLYPIFRMDARVRRPRNCPFTGERIPAVYKTEFAYDLESLVDFVDFHKAWAGKGRYRDGFILAAKKLFDENSRKKEDEPFQKAKTPLFLLSQKSWWGRDPVVTVNPCLQELDFFRIFDAFKCYQEIALYMGGVLGFPQPNTVELADEFLAEKKGFDKFSFRNQGNFRKERRKRHRKDK